MHPGFIATATLSAAVFATGWCAARDDDTATTATTGTAPCSIETERVPMPRALRESSGIAHTAGDALWTHNDGAEAVLYRVTRGGAVEQAVALEGVSASDIEDIDGGPCPGGEGDCLWIADTGDNNARRPEVVLLMVPVPDPGIERVTPVGVVLRYPAGARDAEALAVLPSGDALIVTKGRGAPIELYRVTAETVAGARGAPELVMQMAPAPDRNSDRVTGAGASEDGRWIAIRSNAWLSIHRTDALLSGDPAPAVHYDLRALGEVQGEGVDMTSDGRVWLTSEGEGGGTPTQASLRCTLPD